MLIKQIPSAKLIKDFIIESKTPYELEGDFWCYQIPLQKSLEKIPPKKTIVGFVCTSEKNNNTMIGGLYVLPEHRKEGYGKAIIKAIVKIIKTPTIMIGILRVNPIYSILYNFYIHCGFGIIHTMNEKGTVLAMLRGQTSLKKISTRADYSIADLIRDYEAIARGYQSTILALYFCGQQLSLKKNPKWAGKDLEITKPQHIIVAVASGAGRLTFKKNTENMTLYMFLSGISGHKNYVAN